MGRLTRLEWIVVLMFAPGAMLAMAWLMLLARGSAPHPFLGFEPRNLVEAAALRDGGVLVRRVQAGEDPNRPDTVRAGIFGPDPVDLTPIEAAAAQERPEIIRLLIHLGASPDAEAGHGRGAPVTNRARAPLSIITGRRTRARNAP